uniref:Ion transport domain-containing protein n=1 Tax=Anopheles funestus TaxID=62324 RepID=A0A4Y0BLZ8_ANOFN
MENNLVESIFEAITIGDETMLQNCIEQATIDTVLEFRRSYDESPLHLCVKFRGVNHLGVVRRLLASGLCDSTTVDSEGQTVLQCALAEGEDSELVEALIKVEIDGLDDATACYKVLRHDSLQIFKKFLLIKEFKEEEEFQHIASALIQLNVKNVVLSEDLHHFVLWKLSDYGFRKLSGNWSGTKDPNEWKNHIDVITECWSVIKLQYNTRLYADVDDQFLHRLQTVHNHLYFLKHKQFLAHLPMQQAIFCVAIFLSIYRNPEQFQEYRLMINKCLVIEFVRMISEQLAIVKTYLERTETELLSVMRRILTSNTITKDELIADLLAKIESSNMKNKAYVIKELKDRVERIDVSNKHSLIKDMLDKAESIDKSWTEEKAYELIDKLLERIESSNLPNKVHVMQQVEEMSNAVNNHSLIKELLDKVDTFDQPWTEEKANQLIEDLFAKMISSNLPNKAHVIRSLKVRAKIANAVNKDSLIKDMLEKVKRIDKTWAEEMTKVVKELDKTDRKKLTKKIRKCLRHVSHPQNVVNGLMSDWKRGKATKTIVADIVSGESFTLSHLMRGKDRRIKRKLLKCYSTTKQYYSLRKTVLYCERVRNSNEGEQSNYAEMACMKRAVQVFGETFKNTTNSPNMPGKAEDSVKSMLTKLFPSTSKSYREMFSHNIPLKKVLLGSLDKWVFEEFRSNFNNLRMTVQLLYVIAVEDVRQSFYGYMRQRDTFEKLRSLVLYVEDMKELEQRQLACYKQVTEYYDEAKATFEKLAKEPFGETLNFQQVHERLKFQCEIVSDLSEYFNQKDAFNYSIIRKACFSSDDLSSVRRLLDWKLTKRWASIFFHKMYSWWLTDDMECLTRQCEDERRFLNYFPLINVSILQNGFIIQQAIEKFEYIVHTRQLTQDLKIADKIDEEALQDLNLCLKSYYDDIFTIDKKWKVLETFCKKRKLPWNKDLNSKLLKSDQNFLQELYDSSRNQLRGILERYGLDTVDGLVTRLHDLPTHMLSAIEYIQLELCEMLRAVGYFGDSFHYLKSRIPMIQGINYRNLLAHDALSYNLLTDSSMEKIVINAFVFSNTEIQLFGNTGANKVDINVPTLSQTNLWVDLQKQLLEAFKTNDVQGMHMIGQEGGEMKARFCCTQNESYLPTSFVQLPEVINPCIADVSVVQYLNQYFARFLERCNDLEYQVSMALKFRDFQSAYDRTIALGDRLIRDEMYDWEELMTNVRETDLFVDAGIDKASILRKLIERGNTAAVRDILPYFESFHSTNECGPLVNALMYCVRSIADLLKPLSVPHPGILIFAIIVHWNDIYANMMERAEIDEFTFAYLLKTTVQARNYTAAVYLLENEAFTNFIPYAFVDCCVTAARIGEQSVLQHLLERCPTTSIVNNNLVTILHQAALKKQWHCVQLLLERDVPVDVVNYLSAKHFTLLTLVKYGRRGLIPKIKSIKLEMFGTVTAHPLTVAVVIGTASKRMIRSLRKLGFDWLDCPTTLNAAIESKNKNVFETIQTLVNDRCAKNPSSDLDHFRHALMVLQRWKLISFVEESKSQQQTSLICALKLKDKDMVEELLSWARQMRTIEELGILGGIVFERDTVFTCYGKRNDELGLWNTRDSCEDMITRMEIWAMVGEMIWQQFTLNAQSSTPVTFYVLTTEDEVVKPPQNSTFAMSGSAPLKENLEEFLTFVNIALSNFTIIYAKFPTTDGATRHFWKIEETSCMYDILPPSEKAVDLSDMINYKGRKDETPLIISVESNSLEIVQLLIENGANPLLADAFGITPIEYSLRTLDYSIGRYLLDECVRRDLRNETGCSVLEFFNPIDGDRLIHHAIALARQDIVQRLLELGVNASVVNGKRSTPAHRAVGINLFNVCQIVKMLLDYDPSLIDQLEGNNYTLLQIAVSLNKLKLLHLVLQYKPNLLLRHNGMTALGMAIVLKHIECAKCLLNYAIENNIQEITQADEDHDHVLLSLLCNDYDLSKMLLEYELGHTLQEVDMRDLPRIESLLEKIVTIQQEDSKAPEVQELTFVQELRELRVSIKAKQITSETNLPSSSSSSCK